jgi:hypothetical protein
MTLRRLVIEFKPDGIQLRALYRSSTNTNPSTVRRRKEVQDLARCGLERALEGLQGRADVVGEAGFTQREDVLQLVPPAPPKTAPKGAK